MWTLCWVGQVLWFSCVELMPLCVGEARQFKSGALDGDVNHGLPNLVERSMTQGSSLRSVILLVVESPPHHLWDVKPGVLSIWFKMVETMLWVFLPISQGLLDAEYFCSIAERQWLYFHIWTSDGWCTVWVLLGVYMLCDCDMIWCIVFICMMMWNSIDWLIVYGIIDVGLLNVRL